MDVEKRNGANMNSEKINGTKIKNALSYVHFNEKTEGRVQSAAQAIKIIDLTEGEVNILLSAIHVAKSELINI